VLGLGLGLWSEGDVVAVKGLMRKVCESGVEGWVLGSGEQG